MFYPVLLLIFLTSVIPVQAGLSEGLKSHLADFQALLTGNLPGEPANQEETARVHGLLTDLGHKNPGSVGVRTFNEHYDHKEAHGSYSPHTDTIYLRRGGDEKRARFTEAHEAVHATHKDGTITPILGYFGAYHVAVGTTSFALKEMIEHGYKNGITMVTRRLLNNTVLARAVIPFLLYRKFIHQAHELRADVEGAKALMRRGDGEVLREAIKEFDLGSYDGLRDLYIPRDSFKFRALRYGLGVFTGFHFDETKDEMVVDYARGSSERWWNNWGTHPTMGRRYFTVKHILDTHNSARR